MRNSNSESIAEDNGDCTESTEVSIGGEYITKSGSNGGVRNRRTYDSIGSEYITKSGSNSGVRCIVVIIVVFSSTASVVVVVVEVLEVVIIQTDTILIAVRI